MTPILLAFAATLAPPSVPANLKACFEVVRVAPERAAAAAGAWRAKGGGLDAMSCEGLAWSEAGRWPTAALVFEEAALQAEKSKDVRRADFWVQAGNSWLAGEEPAKARKAFDAAIATNLLPPKLKGEVHLDRARAAVASGDTAGARVDLDEAVRLVPADPFGWYLSAALARRSGDLQRAQAEIAKAVALAPDDAPILLEAGSIAGAAGDDAAGRAFYARAIKAAPDTEAARAAQAALGATLAPAPPGR